MKKYSAPVALKIFVKELHEILKLKRLDKYKMFSQFTKFVMPSIMTMKFNEEVKMMRASKSFVF